MNYTEFASKIKQKYPQYKDMDDRDLSQRMVKKYPQYSDVTFDDQKTDYRGVVGSAVKNALGAPGTVTNKLMFSPTAQAQALPALAGTAGGISPFPGGATLGTVGGRQLSNLALKTYGRPDLIPSGTQQLVEGGLSALGDVAAIPPMKKAYYGGKIGQAEVAQGVVTRGAQKAVTPGSVGETLNNLEAQIDSGVINTAQGAKDAKEIVDQVYMNPRIYEKSPGIKVQSQRISEKVQELLNQMIPGRRVPAEAMSKAMTIPRTIGRALKIIPQPIKRAATYGVSEGLGAGTGFEIIRALLGR